MLAEFLKEMKAQILQTVHPTVLQVPGKNTVFVSNPKTGQLEEFANDSVRVDWSAADIASFCKMLVGLPTQAAVFVSERGVVALLDAKDGHEHITMPVSFSAKFTKLTQPMPTLSVPLMRRWMKLDSDCMESNVEFVQAISRLDFSRRSVGGSSATHGRESLGQSVEAEVQQADAVPEYVNVGAYVLSVGGELIGYKSLRFGVWIDLEKQGIQLQLLPDEVPTAVRWAIEQLQERIASELKAANLSIPVYLGAP